jgi:hypothetical protein
MRTTVRHPIVTTIDTLKHDNMEFHMIGITDNTRDGHLVLLIHADWSDWDKLVAAVDKYRAAALLTGDLS